MGLAIACLVFLTLSRRIVASAIALAASTCAIGLLLGSTQPPHLQGLAPSILKPILLIPWQWRTPFNVLPLALSGFWLAAWFSGWDIKRQLLGLIPLVMLLDFAVADWIRLLWQGTEWYFPSPEPRFMRSPFWTAAAIAMWFTVPRDSACGKPDGAH